MQIFSESQLSRLKETKFIFISIKHTNEYKYKQMAVEEYHVHVYTGKEFEEYEIKCKCWLEDFVE